MSINIETLRFEVQLNKLDNSQIVLSPLVVGELLDRLEEAEGAWKISDQTVYDLTEKVIPNIQEKLEAAESEAIEQARLNGMGAERELALIAKIDRLRRALTAMTKGYKSVAYAQWPAEMHLANEVLEETQ